MPRHKSYQSCPNWDGETQIKLQDIVIADNRDCVVLSIVAIEGEPAGVYDYLLLKIPTDGSYRGVILWCGSSFIAAPLTAEQIMEEHSMHELASMMTCSSRALKEEQAKHIIAKGWCKPKKLPANWADEDGEFNNEWEKSPEVFMTRFIVVWMVNNGYLKIEE